MRPSLFSAVGLASVFGVFCGISSPAHATVTFDLVTVGNAGNAADPSTGGLYGSVGYSYSISKYETTNTQYAEFLNVVDPAGTNTRALYNINMSTDANIAGISFTPGNASGSKYGVLSGQGNKPVSYVSWYDAARMANWMHNGQGAGDTETGVYTLTGNTSVSGGRSASATVFIPNEDEWYKAAYHQPAVAGGDSDNYWLYPTGSNAVMTGDVPAGGASSGNFYGNAGYAVTQSASYSGSQNYLTNAGAYALSDSFYGTQDQGGNVGEWTETLVSGSSRVWRGGSWNAGSGFLPSLYRDTNVGPTLELFTTGFRLAVIPEPASLTVAAAVGLVALKRRARRS